MSERFLMTKLTIDIGEEIYQIRHYLIFGINDSSYFDVYKKEDTDEDDEEEEDDNNYQKIAIRDIEISGERRIVEKALMALGKIETEYTQAEKNFIRKLLNNKCFMDSIEYFEDEIYSSDGNIGNAIYEIENYCEDTEVSINSIYTIDFYKLKDFFGIESLTDIDDRYIKDCILDKLRDEIGNAFPVNWLKYDNESFFLRPSSETTVYYIENISNFMDGVENNFEYLVSKEKDIYDFQALMFKLKYNDDNLTIIPDLNSDFDTLIIFVDIDDEKDLITRLKIYERFKERTGCTLHFISRNCDNFEIIRAFMPWLFNTKYKWESNKNLTDINSKRVAKF